LEAAHEHCNWNRLGSRFGFTRPVFVDTSTTPYASEVLVYINDDGSARELSETEKKYVDTEFSPLDSARPHIKTRYEQRNGWGNLSGFLQRKDVPVGMPINLAQSETTSQQQTPQTVADSISELIRKHGQN
jgi:hypothetical protein